jgi:catechol 2,3-dioxygenase-like lactoylglutathione lyase family enzyme
VDHIAFHAHDFDKIVARLERCGVAARRNDAPGASLKQLFVYDPNGVKIEINVRA